MATDDWQQLLEAISEQLWPILVAIGTGFWFVIGEVRKWRKESEASNRAQYRTEVERAIEREQSAIAVAEELRDREIKYLASEIADRDNQIARLTEKLHKVQAAMDAANANRDRAKIEAANCVSDTARLRKENRALQAALLRVYARVPDAFGNDTMLLLPQDSDDD